MRTGRNFRCIFHRVVDLYRRTYSLRDKVFLDKYTLRYLFNQNVLKPASSLRIIFHYTWIGHLPYNSSLSVSKEQIVYG